MDKLTDKDNDFSEAIKKYELIRNEYAHNAIMRPKYLEAFEQLKIAIDIYFLFLSQLGRDDLMVRYKLALKYLNDAQVEYDKFIPRGSLASGENPPITPFNELEAAHDKIETAEKWLMAITKSIWGKR